MAELSAAAIPRVCRTRCELHAREPQAPVISRVGPRGRHVSPKGGQLLTCTAEEQAEDKRARAAGGIGVGG